MQINPKGNEEPPIIDDEADEVLIQRQAIDLSAQSNYDANRKVAKIPLDMYNDSDVCQGMKKAYDWMTCVSRPEAVTSVSCSIYTAGHAFSNRDNTELNTALRETIGAKYTAFDQIESVSLDALKDRLAGNIGSENVKHLTYAALEEALNTGCLNIIKNGDTASYELSQRELSSINAYLHLNDNAEASCNRGIKEINEALDSLGYDRKMFDHLTDRKLKELLETGKTKIKGKEFKINHLKAGKDGKQIKSTDAVLIENYVLTKDLRKRIKQKEKCKIKQRIKGKEWINKGFHDLDVYQGYLKIKNTFFAVKTACVSSMYIRHYSKHFVDEKIIKKAENTFLKIDLGFHRNAATGYEHTTKFINQKERILDKQQKRTDKFNKRQEKLNKRRERERMTTFEKMKNSKAGKAIGNSKPAKAIGNKKANFRKRISHRYSSFKSRHKVMGHIMTSTEKIFSFLKGIPGKLFEGLMKFKELIIMIAKDAVVVFAVCVAIAYLINVIMTMLSAPSTLIDGEEDPDSTGQKTITAMMEHEDKFLEDIMDVTKYTYTEPSPYDPSQTIKVDSVELKEFVNEYGELISDMGIYKEIFTLASRHFENDPDVDPPTFENYCIELWDASHETKVEYEEYEHAVQDDGVEACSNWQSYTHSELTGSEGDWYDSSTGEKCENYDEHCIEVSDTADSWWASCLGHERCFGHLKATVTVVVTTDLENLMAIDPQKEPSGDWEGWTEDNIELAKFMYEQDWTDFGITFPGSAAGTLSAADVEALIAQITANSEGLTLSPTRLAVIQEALARIGQYKYSYGANHSASAANGAGSDCSGFVGQVLYQSGGYQGFGSSWGGASSFLNIGTQVSPSQIQPGDIIIKNSTPGGTTSSSNHIVIYVGKINGEPMVAECTTYHGVSGSQLNPLSKVANYEYWIHMDY